MKALFLHMDGSRQCPARTRLAFELATRHKLRLFALFAVAPRFDDVPYAYAASGDFARQLEDGYAALREKVWATFEAVRAGGASTWATWSELGLAPSAQAFSRQTLFADLLVLGQHDRTDPQPHVSGDFVPSVLLASGRPGLIVPGTGRFLRAGGNVVVAWKPTATATRAVSAALPLLRQARTATVVEWGRAPGPAGAGALDIEVCLRLHGVQAQVQRQVEEPHDVGRLLLERAADLGADLLVMGCYGKSPTRERLMGGATRTVLESMTLPVLMCH